MNRLNYSMANVLLGTLLFCSTCVATTTAQAPSPQASVPVVDVSQEAFVIDWDHVINVLLAGLVGILGALSFYYGVYTGFINPDSRERTLKYFSGSIWIKLHYTGMFCLLGGVVAAVFQAAQASTFAPIQAFVLGATWPSVVTRIMSGGAEPTVFCHCGRCRSKTWIDSIGEPRWATSNRLCSRMRLGFFSVPSNIVRPISAAARELIIIAGRVHRAVNLLSGAIAPLLSFGSHLEKLYKAVRKNRKQSAQHDQHSELPKR